MKSGCSTRGFQRFDDPGKKFLVITAVSNMWCTKECGLLLVCVVVGSFSFAAAFCLEKTRIIKDKQLLFCKVENKV